MTYTPLHSSQLSRLKFKVQYGLFRRDRSYDTSFVETKFYIQVCFTEHHLSGYIPNLSMWFVRPSILFRCGTLFSGHMNINTRTHSRTPSIPYFHIYIFLKSTVLHLTLVFSTIFQTYRIWSERTWSLYPFHGITLALFATNAMYNIWTNSHRV